MSLRLSSFLGLTEFLPRPGARRITGRERLSRSLVLRDLGALGVRRSRRSSTSSGCHWNPHFAVRLARTRPTYSAIVRPTVPCGTVVITRLATDPQNRAYMEGRVKEGRSKYEVLRTIKRIVAREVYRTLHRGHEQRARGLGALSGVPG